mmetsp:Transcript_668/g.1813  ORF Transcript_668/g.1813 Transcript_668/m.1813 type:complete len:531 (-) Transcript_668:1575-3167(-)
MHSAEGPEGVVTVDHGGDVGLVAALSNGANVDARLSKGTHHLPCHTRAVGHTVAYHGEDGHVLLELHVLDVPRRELGAEDLAQRLLGLGPICGKHGHRNGLLGRSLRNGGHVDGERVERVEEARAHAGDAHHATALDVEKAHVLHDGHTAHFAVRRGERGGLEDARATVLGRKSIADEDGDGTRVRPPVEAREGRLHGLRVHHLGAKVRQLRRLVVGHLGQHVGVRHHSRVGGEHARHISPDGHLLRLEKARKDGCGVVGPVATEGGDATLLGGGDETRCHEGGTRMALDKGVEPRRGLVPFDGHARGHRVIAHHEHRARVQVDPVACRRGRGLGGIKECGHHARRPLLAVAADDAHKLLVSGAHEPNCAEEVEDVREVRLELRDEAHALSLMLHPGHHLVDCFEVLDADLLDDGLGAVKIVGHSRSHRVDEQISHLGLATHGGHHDAHGETLVLPRNALNDVAHLVHGRGRLHRRAAKLVHAMGLAHHRRHDASARRRTMPGFVPSGRWRRFAAGGLPDSPQCLQDYII